MIVIAEGGSTKCDWVLLGKEGLLVEFKTKGFNPLFHTKEAIVNTLRGVNEIREYGPQAEEVFFYGAGSATPELRDILKKVLLEIFPNAKNVQSHTDAEAAAFSTYNGNSAISCILGTGSNSCYFDGKTLSQSNPALGFILGDEASGAYFGKQLLAQFLYKQMPNHLWLEFNKSYDLGKKEIIEKVYRDAHSNVFLASFMPFYYKHRSEPYIQKILKNGFRRFLLIHVLCFENHKKYPVHFVGSIAHFFKEELLSESERLGLRVGEVVQKPILGLIKHHQLHSS
jgi:N-acetylglucosamine kinase-like BadF-type ATPase